MDQIILFWLLGNWICLGFTSASGLSPRRIYNYGDSSRVLKYFKRPDIKNCSTLLLSEDEQTLYVGAQDKIIFLKIAKDFSMELQQPELSWAAPESERKTCYRKGKDYQTKCINLIRILKQVNATHLYACGTYAFNPQCAYIDLKTFSIITSTKESGGGRCPYDPNIKFAATMVDGELYAGTVDTFQGTVPTITRSLGTRPSLKTEASVNWLKDPVFVGSDFVPSSTEGDKVYFFFTETALEYDFTENLKVPRIARVCTNDIGGDRVLQRKWTTFLKVRLSCNPTNDIPYNIIQDSFFLKTPANPDDSTFYGIFNFQWRGRTEGKQSTICAFKLKDVEKAFKSTFKKLDKDSHKWITIPFDSIPSPRPGSCNINTSFDNIFLFMKEHFLMEGKVLPDREQPLLAQVERYTKIVVEKVLVPFKQKAYDVMFLGTESGFLQKIVTTNSGPHIIESIQLFENQEPVQNLLLSTKKGVLYVGYSSGIVQIPVTNCNAYRTCGDCVLARDPYCGWDNSKQACQRISAEMNAGINWLQDIEEGKADSCKTTLRPRSKHPFPTEIIYKELNSFVMLSCSALSNHATLNWTLNGNKLGHGYFVLPNTSLMFHTSNDKLGVYECSSMENGFSHPVANYLVELLPSSTYPIETIEQKTVDLETTKTTQSNKPNHHIDMAKTTSYSTNQQKTTTDSYRPKPSTHIEKVASFSKNQYTTATRVTTADEKTEVQSVETKIFSKYINLENKYPPEKDIERNKEDFPKSYWPNFVVVTILLVMTIVTILALLFYIYHGKSSLKTKVGDVTSVESKKLNSSETEDSDACQQVKQEKKHCSVHMEENGKDMNEDALQSSTIQDAKPGDSLTANHD